MTKKFFLDDCLTVAQYASRMGVTRQCVYGWIGKGLPVFDSFGVKYIHVPSSNEWMQSQTSSKNTPRRAKGPKLNAEPEAAA